MIRSLFAGVSAVRNEQVRMDTIGNNIANVNTTGFKAGKTNFMDTLSQNIRGYGEGRNPMQVGTGVNVASVGTNMTQGALQMTGRSLDLAINGTGFFMVNQTGDKTTSPICYTRDGNFYLDDKNYLRTSQGYYVLDSAGAKILASSLTTDPIDTINIGQDGTITYTSVATTTPTDLGQKIALSTFMNPEGLAKVSTNLYKETTASGAPTPGDADSPGFGTIESGYLEMANADLSEEFTNMITTQRGYQAGARIITVSDTLLEELINLKRS